ncbi:hypothetical protein Q5762_38180, partial [Streptomyces sp. P9(2023)]|uniref:hypothetical protein n=1 Tax=Streptomyces sp. P9(2023) TaxID=3064394 RepID=UPI0028F44A50
VEEYAQATRNVAALKRAEARGLERFPGQDVEYVVVDDAKSSRDRVQLAHENPDTYDTGFYRERAIRAALVSERYSRIRSRSHPSGETTLSAA